MNNIADNATNKNKIRVSGKEKQGLLNIFSRFKRKFGKKKDVDVDEIAKKAVNDLLEQETKKISLSDREKAAYELNIKRKNFSLSTLDKFYELWSKYNNEFSVDTTTEKLIRMFTEKNKSINLHGSHYIILYGEDGRPFDIAKKIFKELVNKGLAKTIDSKYGLLAARYKNYILLHHQYSEVIVIILLDNVMQEMAVEYDPQYPERMHPQVQSDIEKEKGLYGKHPSFPKMSPEDKQKFAEIVTSDRFKKALEKVRRYAGQNIRRADDLIPALFQAIQNVIEIERDNREELERLAIRLAMQDNNVKQGEIVFDAKLVDPPKMSISNVKIHMQQEEPIDVAEDLANVDLEVAKRRLINGMIHGAAEKGQYMFHLVEDELNNIYPDLVDMYGLMQSLGDYLIWIMPNFNMGEEDDVRPPAGMSEIEKLPDGRYKVIARAINFPLLLNELVKGIMEVISLHGLPKQKDIAKKVMNKADFLDAEVWDRRFGPGLWGKFIDAIGAEDQEIRSYLYGKIVSMPAEEFHKFMQQLMSGSKEGKSKLAAIAKDIKDDIKQADYEDNLKKSNDDLKDITEIASKKAVEMLLVETVVEDNINKAANFALKHLPKEQITQDDLNQMRNRIAKDVVPSDPTLNKQNLMWMIKQMQYVDPPQFELPEDHDNVFKVLDFFEKNKIKSGWTQPKDINAYTFTQLQDTVDKVSGVELKGAGKKARKDVLPGSELVYDDGTYSVIRVDEYDAACKYGEGTKLCTKFPENAQRYLSENPLYILTKGGVKFAQFDLGSSWFKDMDNKDLPMTNDIRNVLAKVFEKQIDDMTPKEALNFFKITKIKSDKLEYVISKDASTSYDYAQVTKQRFEKGEKAILSNIWNANNYAREILKARWPELEKKLIYSKNIDSAITYTSHIIQQRWPELEDLIKKEKSGHSAASYAISVLKTRWPEMELYILSSGSAENYVDTFKLTLDQLPKELAKDPDIIKMFDEIDRRKRKDKGQLSREEKAKFINKHVKREQYAEYKELGYKATWELTGLSEIGKDFEKYKMLIREIESLTKTDESKIVTDREILKYLDEFLDSYFKLRKTVNSKVISEWTYDYYVSNNNNIFILFINKRVALFNFITDYRQIKEEDIDIINEEDKVKKIKLNNLEKFNYYIMKQKIKLPINIKGNIDNFLRDLNAKAKNAEELILLFADSSAPTHLYDSEFIKFMKYISTFYKGQLPNLEKVIARNGEKLAVYSIVTGEKYGKKFLPKISKTINGSFIWAMYVVDKRVPELEHMISKNFSHVLQYSSKYFVRLKDAEPDMFFVHLHNSGFGSSYAKSIARYIKRFDISDEEVKDIANKHVLSDYEKRYVIDKDTQ